MNYTLQHHRGFTLIEIMVVVTIIGIMTGIIALNVSSKDPQKELDKEILRLKTIIEMAQEEALFSQQEIGIIVDEQSYKFVRWSSPNAATAPQSDGAASDDDKATQMQQVEKKISQMTEISEEERKQLIALTKQIDADQGATIEMMAAAGLSLSGDDSVGIAEWRPITGERTFRDYELDEQYEIILEVDHEELDLTGGVDEETRENAKAADKILEEEEELEPAIFILSSGEMSPFVLEIELRDDSDISGKLSGDETGRVWIGDDDEFERRSDDFY